MVKIQNVGVNMADEFRQLKSDTTKNRILKVTNNEFIVNICADSAENQYLGNLNLKNNKFVLKMQNGGVNMAGVL